MKTNQEKAEQLRLAAKIIEEGLEWEYASTAPESWSQGNHWPLMELCISREVPIRIKPKPAWKLPDPPEGMKWHREDGWTEGMLPAGYRPLLAKELQQMGDEGSVNSVDFSGDGILFCINKYSHGHPVMVGYSRTLRPLPQPPEYVPLGPKDMPPNSVIRTVPSSKSGWSSPVHVGPEGFFFMTEGSYLKDISWKDAMDEFEILRPGSTTWEPCKKLKQ